MKFFPTKSDDLSREFKFGILGAIIASIVFLAIFKSQHVLFMQNYWQKSLLLTLVLFLILAIAIYYYEFKYSQKSIGWHFYMYFLFVIPAVSFYILPMLIHEFMVYNSPSHKVELEAKVEAKYSGNQADEPHVIFNIKFDKEIKNVDLPIVRDEFDMLKTGEVIIMHGTLSDFCFHYNGHKKLN